MTPHPDLLRLKEPPLLCHPVYDYRGRMPDGQLLVDIKYDGVRALWLDRELLTQQGFPIGGVEHLAAALRRLDHRYGRPMFYDAEMIIGGSFMASARQCAFRYDAPAAPGAVLHIFDAVPLDDWHSGHPPTPIHERRAQLADKIARLNDDAIRCAHGVTLDSPADVEKYAAGVIVDGHEGVVIKPASGLYKRERQGAWLRIKRNVTYDCKILGIVPHPDSQEMIGGLAVEHDGSRVKIVRGFTDDQRAELWEDRALIAGRYVEVEAMGLTEKGKLRQPRFSRIRYERIWK